MAKEIILVDIDWSGGKQLEDGTWTGAIPILPTSYTDPKNPSEDIDDLLKDGGFDGWYSGNEPGMITLAMAEKDKLPQAHVHIWCDDDNLVKISKMKKPDGKPRFLIKELKSEKAQKKKPELDPENNGD